jgi:single-stranded-DNA-specific exonuclease
MINFGGHAYAAGLTLAKKDLEIFKLRFNDEVAKRITADQLIPKIKIDGYIGLEDINYSFYNILKQLSPFGPMNMRPVFETQGLVDTGFSKIVGENHLKLSLKDKKGNRINGIAFRMADKLSLLQAGTVDVCFVIDENHWNGKSSLEINVRDFRASEA